MSTPRLIACTLAVLGALLARPAPAEQQRFEMLTPADIKWGQPPPTLPSGAKLAVLYGDPTKEGLFVVRLSMPAGYQIPPHWHPTDESITVVSGTFRMGMGDHLDPEAAAVFPPGSFLMTPAHAHHFAIARVDTIVQVTAMGPFAITYVNPKDDPNKH